MYRNRTRRTHRTTVLAARKNGGALITAKTFLQTLGFGDEAKRYAAQITKTVKKLGYTPGAHTWTTVNGRARRTARYDLRTQALVLIIAAITYKRSRAALGLAA